MWTCGKCGDGDYDYNRKKSGVCQRCKVEAMQAKVDELEVELKNPVPVRVKFNVETLRVLYWLARETKKLNKNFSNTAPMVALDLLPGSVTVKVEGAPNFTATLKTVGLDELNLDGTKLEETKAA